MECSMEGQGEMTGWNDRGNVRCEPGCSVKCSIKDRVECSMEYSMECSMERSMREVASRSQHTGS